MAKYKVLKEERDSALERAVLAERNSQLETLNELRASHAKEIAKLQRAYAVALVALQAQIDEMKAAAMRVRATVGVELGSALFVTPPAELPHHTTFTDAPREAGEPDPLV